jgi:hypothetical protein
MHDLRTADVRQHLERLVHRHDRMPKADQLVRDASGAAAKLEHHRRRVNRGVHDLSLAAGWKPQVEVDRAAVGCDSH